MIWKSKRNRDRQKHSGAEAVKRRSCAPERLEARRLLAADPIHVGVVYIETDYIESDQDVGGDSRGDRFILSFRGGAPGTELSEIRIHTDKDADGITVGDPIYDTTLGGRGKSGAHGFEIVHTEAGGDRDVGATAIVEDGGQELVLMLTNFRAGDRLEFTIDVDEVLRNAIDLAVFNDRLDVITSGQEFQDSLLEATFHAPHYESSVADAIFLNDYGTPSDSHGLNLPPDFGDDPSSRPNRSAAAVASTVQVPKPVEIGGHVWLDNDLDAIREPGEPGLQDATVSLWRFDPLADQYADTGMRATTDSDGRYHFPKSMGILPGTYRVVETQPEGVFSVAAVPGTVEGTASGQSESADAIRDIELSLGDTSAIDYDFAEAQAASLSGSVYRDDNDNGLRESSEPGIAGVRVTLVPINTIAPQSRLTVTTNQDGSYAFTGLAPGHYEVIEVDQPAELHDGKDSAGSVNGSTRGVADSPGDRISSIHLAGADQAVGYHFGELPLSTLSGFVFLAAPGEDCNGPHNTGDESPLADVRLTLQNNAGESVATTTTGFDGSYLFENLTPGNYRIVQITPDGLLDGMSKVGRIENVTVGTAVNGGLIQDITLTAGGDGVAYNFCEASPASIRGQVYHDRSDDGIRDTNETGIGGVRLTLVDAFGQTVAVTTTDNDGRYAFTELDPGQYSVIQTQPDNYLDGIDSIGSVRGQGRGEIGSGGDSLAAIELRQGDDGVDYNFGELVPASISGHVHVDVDGDCVRDDDEPLLAGVVLRLLNDQGIEVGSTTTNETGQYTFAGLRPGNYTIVQDQPVGFFEGTAHPGNAGGDATGPSRIGNVTLASGEIALDYDFCEKPGAEISGFVFIDSDNDCTFDDNERGIEGVRVELYDGDGRLVATTQADANGRYRFSHLPAGQYSVVERQPSGLLHGSQMAGSHGGDDSVTDLISDISVDWGQRITEYNFCEIEPASIGGSVFVDGNGDCVQNPHESAMQGVVMELRDAAGTRIATTTTDENGQYEFAGLAPGQYQIFELQPSDAFDGDESPGTGLGHVISDDLLGVTLLAGETLVDYNFCELEGGSIGGHVWHQPQPDDQFDAGDVPVPGVLVELIDSSGDVVGQAETNASGGYLFDSIAPGVYSVREIQPEGLFHAGQVIGSVGGAIGDDDLLVGIVVGSGVAATDYNFHETPPASISGFVFQDGDSISLPGLPEPADLRQYSDGLLTDDDARLGAVTVELRDSLGRPVDGSDALAGHYPDGPIRAVTDVNGHYQFTGLRPDTYHLYQIQPEDFFDGLDTPGTAGGVALNAADSYDEVTLSSILGLEADESTDPGRDAILNISLVGGQSSEQNNFSELVFVEAETEPLQAPSAEFSIEIAETPRDQPPLIDLLPPVRLVTFAAPPTGDRASLVAIDEWAVSWHLSVINGGFPRGDDGGFEVMRHVSTRTSSENWTDGNHSTGKWTAVDVDGNPIERASLMILGEEEAIALSGDFDGDGFDEAAIFVGGQWFVDLNGNGRWDSGDLWMRLGTALDRPVVGDWDGDGKDDIAIFGRQWQHDPQRIKRDPGLPDPENKRRRMVDARQVAVRRNVEKLNTPKRLLRRGDDGKLRADAVDHVFQYGDQVDTPVSGDWNGDGIDQIAIFRGGQWLLDNDGDGRWSHADSMTDFGQPGDEPIVGDFDGDDIDEIGVVRGDLWIIDSDGDRRITGNDLHIRVPRDGESSQPIVGDFDGDGKDDLGYYDDDAA